MSFLKPEEIDSMSQDELVDALVYSNESLDPTPEATRNIRSFYSMLPLEELKERARGGLLIRESKPVVVTPQEQRRRDREYEKARSQKTEVVRPQSTFKRSRVYTAQERVIIDLALLKWVDDVTEICPDVIGLRANISKEEAKKKFAKIAEKYGYTGDVIYG